MSVIKSNGAGDPVSSGFYSGATSRSLRMQNARLTRTPSSTGNPKKWTFSVWLKRASLGSSYIFSGSPLGSGYDGLASIYFNGSDQLHTYYDTSGSNPYGNVSSETRVYRDLSSWYHLCWAVDAANTTHKIWINNNLVSTNTSRYPPNVNYGLNNSGDEMVIGDGSWDSYGSVDFNGYMAEINYLDDQYLEPDSFAETKNGVWIPLKDPSLTYGTNGFRLQFLATGTSADSSGIGADTSGQGNHYALTSLAAGDVVLDNPENNFATLNPLIKGYASTGITEGSLKVVGTGSAGAATYSTVASTMELTGKVYFEVYINALTATGRNGVGIVGENYLMNRYGTFGTVGISGFDQAGDAAGVGTGDDDWNTAKSGNAATETTIGYTGGGSDTVADVGDIVQIAYDSATGYAWYGVINRDSSDAQAWFNSGNPANGSGYVGILDTAVKQFAAGYVQSSSDSLIFNFGQDGTFANSVTAQGNTDSNGVGDFYGTVPSGFVAACSANLPKVTIGPNSDTQATNHFGVLTWSGDNDARDISVGASGITGTVDFTPDWAWIKRRNGSSNGSDHLLIDTSRGVNDHKGLATNGNEIETLTEAGSNWTNFGDIVSFKAGGFNGSSSGTEEAINQSGGTYVAWNWRANGGTTTTNDASATSVGDIDSVHQANTSAGFSIVLYNGNGTNNTDLEIAHGLGATPKMVWIKNRSTAKSWQVYNSNFSADGTYGIKNTLLDTGGAEDAYSDYIKTTSSTTFTIRSDSSDGVGRVNKSGDNYVAYCFAEIEGFSRIGKYFGNGNSDGAYIYVGFRPAWVITKPLASGNWYINDTTRSTYNQTNSSAGNLYADLTNTEGGNGMDILSNGFKIRNTDSSQNTNGNGYIYMAFAEAPFAFANAR